MPEMRFVVRWPDDSVSRCYSPSLVVKEYLEIGQRYTLARFVSLTATALTIGSERVREKYGFACSAALDQLQSIQATAARFSASDDAYVVVEAFEP